MKKDNRIFLIHILDAIKNIEEYVKDIKIAEEFANNKIVRDAVLRNFEIIGEAAKQLDEEYVKEHAQINWTKVIGMRNFLIHEYFGVDLGIVWETIKKDLPSFKKGIKDLISLR